MNAIDFHNKMHALIFRHGGANKLGAVQTTIVWQFVIFHFKKLPAPDRQQLVRLQDNVNQAEYGDPDMEKAIDLLLDYIRQHDSGER